MWGLLIVYCGFLCYVIYTYKETVVFLNLERVLDVDMVKATILSPQRMYFINTLFVAVILYVTRVDFLSPEVAVRYHKRPRILRDMLINGVIIAMLYTALTHIVLTIGAVILGYPITANLLESGALLFMAVFFFYLFYLAVYIVRKNHVLAIFALISVNILVLGIGVALYFYEIAVYYLSAFWVYPQTMIPMLGALLICDVLLILRKDLL
jgi:hypothetical protein